MDSLALVAIALAVLAVVVTVVVLRRSRQDSSYGRVPLSLDEPAFTAPPVRQHNVTLSGADMAAVNALLAGGNKIEAIKRVRELTGLGLKEAKDYVEAMPSGGSLPTLPGAPVGIPTQGGAPTTSADLSEVYLLAQQGNKIQAIKRYRELTGVGLKEAKDFVDRL